jgi:hypothetical protein
MAELLADLEADDTSRDRSAAGLSSPAISVFGGDPLRNHHPPRVEDELSHLVDVDRVEPDLNPVVAEVPAVRHQELDWLRTHECLALLLREREPHDRLVTRERQIDDAADAELHAVADERLGRPRKSKRERSNIVDVDHASESTRERSRDPSTGNRIASLFGWPLVGFSRQVDSAWISRSATD